MKKFKLTLATLVIASTLVANSGCGRMGHLALRTMVTVIAVASILQYHDAHYHHYDCGHNYVFVEERPVYNYEGRWEYYDPDTGHWYTYDNLQP